MKAKIKPFPVILGIVLVLGLPPIFLLTGGPAPEPPVAAAQPADPLQAVVAQETAFEDFYRDWQKAYVKAGGDRDVRVTLGWTEGLSTERSAGRGEVSLDMIDGALRAEVKGLDGQPADLWLVDNQDGPGKTVQPEPGDRMFRIGRLASGSPARIAARLGREFFRDFELDLVVVSRAGKTPAESSVLIGGRSFFERLYTATRLEAERAQQATRLAGFLSPGFLGSALEPRAAEANSSILISNGLVTQAVGLGGDLFFRGVFSGNGRTCGTCHRVDNNQGLDLDFIQSLPNNDKLFVAELPVSQGGVPGLERPQLMRNHALILENTDGFAPDPTVRFTMRGVPHSLSMARSILAPVDGRAPVQRTGWSGDGAPNTGALRFFPVGAVTQHFTKRLNRVSGVDFVLPTDTQLDRMEAFSLASGRLNELNLAGVTLLNSAAQAGKVRFVATDARCNGCHANAGANIAPGTNLNFDTGVERGPDPSQATETHPRDGGFGSANRDCDGNGSNDCFGDGSFNTTPLIEAADTEPFFHNNSAATIEDATAFYTTQAFAQSPAGGGTAVPLTATDIANIGKFLRVTNASFNAAISIQRNNAALALENSTIGNSILRRLTADNLLFLSTIEAIDALDVLSAKNLHFDAQFLLLNAISKNSLALIEFSSTNRKNLIQSATADLTAARAKFGTGLNFTLGPGNLMF